MGSAFSPLMYQDNLAAGKLFREIQVTLTVSPILYRGWPPRISGPSSGKSGKLEFIAILQNALFNWSVRLFTPTKNQCSMRESGKISKIRLLLPTQFAVSAPQEGALTTKMSKYFPKRSLFKIELSVENLLESYLLAHWAKTPLFIQNFEFWENMGF